MSIKEPPRFSVTEAVSAGGVVWRRDSEGNVEVVIGYQSNQRRWALPKGTPELGEELEETAIREVLEETGLEVELGEKVGVIDYWFVHDGRRFHKRVHHWLMTVLGGDLDAHDHEFDEVIWTSAGQALSQVTFETERSILEQALTILDEDV